MADEEGVRGTSCRCVCVHVCLCVSGTSQITKSSLHVYKAWNKWRIKEISLGNNNRHHISVAAKIIPLSAAGCLTGRMGVNPLTFFLFIFFYLVCVRSADYLLPAQVWPLVAKRQQKRDAFLAAPMTQIDIKAV